MLGANKKNLRNTDKLIVTLVAVVLIAITAVATKFAIGAADANINASVSPGTVQTEQHAIVTVRAQTGTQSINVARARVTYDATKWQFVSADYTGVPFVDRTPEPPAHQGNGYYEVTGYRISAPFPSGDILLGKVTLKAISPSASTPIGIDQSNSELYESVNATKILGSVTGTVATINAPSSGPNPAPTPQPTPPPASSGGSTKKSTGTSGTSNTTGTTANNGTGTQPTDETSTTGVTQTDDKPAANLAEQSASSRQSFISKYRLPILVAGVGLLVAAGASYAVAMLLHRRNLGLGSSYTTSNGISGAVIGSGLYGPSTGTTHTPDSHQGDDHKPSDPAVS